MNAETTIPLGLEKEFERWYPLIDHDVQLAMIASIDNGIRFPVVPSGRRSGKSERFKRFIAKRAMTTKNQMYFVGGPTYAQAKKIFWSDLKLLTFSSTHPKKPSESNLILFLPNGTELHVLGLDKPQRIEGVNWTGGGIDEIADVKSQAIEENIMPALNTIDPRRPDYRPWCWFIGVPDGLNHFYRMAEMAKSDLHPEYGHFHWKSADILPPDVIEAAKRTMSPMQYRIEYEACHMPDTLVPMYEGGRRRISDLRPGDTLLHVSDAGKIQPCTVLNGGYTKSKPIMTATLETGHQIQCSPDHKFKIDGDVCQLQNADYLELYAPGYRPVGRDECLAALVGYNLSDGTVTFNKTRECFKAYFYGDEAAMEDISRDADIVFDNSHSVSFKRGASVDSDVYQVALTVSDTKTLIGMGAVAGKKVEQFKDVPEWIKNGPKSVQRAFLAAVFGAEGTTPRPQNKSPAMPMLSMHARKVEFLSQFFSSMESILLSFGVDCSVTIGESTSGIRCSLYVTSGAENIKRFFSECGYLYSEKKQTAAWQWIQYLDAAQHFIDSRRIRVSNLTKTKTYAEVAAEEGCSIGHIWRTVNNPPGQFRIPKEFPAFESWIGKRLGANSALKLGMSSVTTEGAARMYNILVNSHDHSYLVDIGLNNFNSFENATGRIYGDYSGQNQTTETIRPHEQLHWTHDQNYTPLSSAISVLRDDESAMYILDEIVLMSAEARQSANEFVDKFKNHKNRHVIIYGDPYGRIGEKHGHKSDYIDIENVLKKNGWRFTRKVPPAHPPIKDRQNAVRARIFSADGVRKLFVNPQKAPWSHEGLATVQLKEGSTFQEDDSNKYQHITTAIGYQVHKLWPSGVSPAQSQMTTGFLI